MIAHIFCGYSLKYLKLSYNIGQKYMVGTSNKINELVPEMAIDTTLWKINIAMDNSLF
jgi:hypothetical protein